MKAGRREACFTADAYAIRNPPTSYSIARLRKRFADMSGSPVKIDFSPRILSLRIGSREKKWSDFS
ncbi:MAG: hypothetical protein LUH07_11290, partial [Lachnospiraceae bacterium]|nr:hypothetical protein [Lachnospiraceae bacterium]